MTATKTMIEDAIKGGYKGEIFKNSRGTQIYSILSHDAYWLSETVQTMQKDVSLILLDPTFWQAVGKTRGWGHQLVYPLNVSLGSHKIRQKGNGDVWQFEMCSFMFYLADGLTIEEALNSI